jgi:predicted PolB exonuclease-like 3'-5' exonuclease
MQDQLCDQGAAYGPGLDDVARLVGLPGKYNVTGSKVRELWPEKADEVARYCAEDVAQTWLIYLSWCRTFRGWSSKLDEIEDKWWRWACEQPILRPLLEHYKDLPAVVAQLVGKS